MKTLEEIGKSAKAAEPVLRIMGTNQKNEALLHVAEKLLEEKAFVLAENVKDVEKATANGMAQGMIDRLMLDDNRIEGMAEGIRQGGSAARPGRGSYFHETASQRPDDWLEESTIGRYRYDL